MCATVGDALEKAARENGSGRQTKMAVWRPFIFDPGRNQWNVRDEQTAAEKGMVPWLQKCVLAVCIATAPVGEEDAWSYQPGILEFILRYEKWCYELSEILPWERKCMDTSQITRWLNRCVTEHGEQCSKSWVDPSINMPRGFRLIDVHERRVVLPQAPFEYVALSYVWSTASSSPEKQKLQLYSGNLKELEEVNSLGDSILPEVVADAVHLCAEIGHRYLWVDRFCIVQDDLDLKAEQIDAMGVIYDRAFLTFVALGDDPTPGLTGLACRPRQLGFHNRSWDLLPTMSNPVGEARIPLMDMALSESQWNDRAWTFQERALSKRRIYFDSGHVYGHCYKEKWQEKPHEVDEVEWRKSAPWEMNEAYERSWDFDVDSFETYSAVINQFSPRKLTFQADVLRAFAGISNVLVTKLKRPILLGHPEEFFSESLRWVPEPGFMSTRRILDDVPSWSWASWDGRANWKPRWTIAPGIFLAADVTAMKASFVKFYISDPKEGLRPVKERHQSLESYLAEQKRVALKVIKEAATSWWPSSISDDPSTVGDEEANELARRVWDYAQHKAQDTDSQPWPPSTVNIPRSERLHDLSEEKTAFAALRNLEVHIETTWWPPTITKNPEASRQLGELSEAACALAEGRPNSLVFNTTCANLRVGPFGRAWFVIPPRRNLSGCAILTPENIPVGITMAMAPQMTFDLFRGKNECLVALLGVCSAKRWMQWDKGERSRLPTHFLYEPCLAVMILEEKDGVCNRLAVGVVYADEWVKLQPQWRTLVVA